ncbi:hypothetical protein G7Y89_g12082 [Cudoniella acicularis]|uniref:C2H2-type domain-containing protein n=1 Tax=Cudoniella acicularis TaxID=354080 RepID=A0A8H4VXP8_9HELO|nr:hypothetical protein G7Y89_g12082 [Cudoniella acicularis]
MTTAVENQQPHFAPPDDVYDSDDVGRPMSPQLKPVKVNLQLSPTPPLAIPIPPPPASDDSTPPESPISKDPQNSKIAPHPSDAGLINIMAGGTAPDVARRAGNEPLATERDGERKQNGTHIEVPLEGEEFKKPEAGREPGENDQLELAAQAYDAMQKIAQASSPREENGAIDAVRPKADAPQAAGDRMEDVKPTIPAITATYVESIRSHTSPEIAKLEIKSPAIGELPPIRQRSPHSGLPNGSGGPITLPSISDQLGDLSHIPEPVAQGESPYAQSPPGPGRPPPRFSAVGHGSPPKSPNDTFRRELPSPGRSAFFNYSAPRRPSQSEGIQYSSAGDYSSSNTETPSTDQSGATPAIDRMSIDGITNPQIGGFQCTYPGCTAQPFQTQYLLNSHANVHSSNRPHYCSVKGCPRSEGGKGFKRKNEMIRHGLVHDSPGYVSSSENNLLGFSISEIRALTKNQTDPEQQQTQQQQQQRYHDPGVAAIPSLEQEFGAGLATAVVFRTVGWHYLRARKSTQHSIRQALREFDMGQAPNKDFQQFQRPDYWRGWDPQHPVQGVCGRENSKPALPGFISPEPVTSDEWKLKTSEADEYVFCHDDLSQQNIIVDPDTLKIKAIIDWEYAGFFPEYFEREFFQRLMIGSNC